MTITLSRAEVALLTDRIEAAQNTAQPIAKLTDEFPAMTWRTVTRCNWSCAAAGWPKGDAR